MKTKPVILTPAEKARIEHRIHQAKIIRTMCMLNGVPVPMHISCILEKS